MWAGIYFVIEEHVLAYHNYKTDPVSAPEYCTLCILQMEACQIPWTFCNFQMSSWLRGIKTIVLFAFCRWAKCIGHFAFSKWAHDWGALKPLYSSHFADGGVPNTLDSLHVPHDLMIEGHWNHCTLCILQMGVCQLLCDASDVNELIGSREILTT